MLESWANGSGEIGCYEEGAQRNVIERNRLYDNEGNGIVVSGGDGNVLRNNLIYRHGLQGINVEIGGKGGNPTDAQRRAEGNQIFHNTVTGSKREGVAVNREARDTAVVNNIVYANGNGIYNVGTATDLRANLTTDPGFVEAGDADRTDLPIPPAPVALLEPGPAASRGQPHRRVARAARVAP